jgi:hypothetical protein
VMWAGEHVLTRCSGHTPYIGELSDEGRMRIGDTGPRQIIQWISKAWTGHELTLPVLLVGGKESTLKGKD